MDWHDLKMELDRTSPDTFELTHVEANPDYDRINGKLVRLSVVFDAIIFEFTGKYKDKYKAIVRVWSDSRVTASIELKGNGIFEYPVTKEDEHFEKRLNIYGTPDMKNNPAIKAELKEIYDWTFKAYRNLA